VASYDKGYICPAGRAQRLLIWIGARSYALYLVHPFAFFGTREIMGRLFPGHVFNDSWLPVFLVLGWGVAFGLAALNYSLIENPLRRRGIRQAGLVADRINRVYEASVSGIRATDTETAS
jgi:peptidoglycan/LPS O-acetylase OafA/YrhL